MEPYCTPARSAATSRIPCIQHTRNLPLLTVSQCLLWGWVEVSRGEIVKSRRRSIH